MNYTTAKPVSITATATGTLRTVDQIVNDIGKVDVEAVNLKRKRDALLAELQNVSARALEAAAKLA